MATIIVPVPHPAVSNRAIQQRNPANPKKIDIIGTAVQRQFVAVGLYGSAEFDFYLVGLKDSAGLLCNGDIYTLKRVAEVGDPLVAFFKMERYVQA